MKINFLVFIIEDDPIYGEILEYQFALNPNCVVRRFKAGKEALAALDQQPDLITLDYKLPDLSGAEVLKKIIHFNPDLPVVIISGQDDIGTAITLLKDGAYDYIVKNDNTKERIWSVVRNIQEKNDLKQEILELKNQISRKYDFSKSILANSSAMKRVISLIQIAIESNITVSITGETGTGKVVVAKAIHYSSSRKNKPFVAVNITAIPSELIESELFGHEKGAFTGAIMRRIGKFEEAGDGTIFLDEIGEMDINMQSKLLRVIQERELTRVGGSGVIKLNCRIMVATHMDLADEVKKGSFREDLFYRLLGLPIQIPPLRERDNDILLLAKHFVNEYSRENKIPKIVISPEAQNKILKYPWPGNIRELKAVIELACVMTDSNVIEEDHISFNTTGSIDTLLQNEMSLEEYKFKIIKYFLEKYNGDVLTVSRKLDLGKSTIYRLLQEKAI
jgi:DNA-binding NtrC family response regulator